MICDPLDSIPVLLKSVSNELQVTHDPHRIYIFGTGRTSIIARAREPFHSRVGKGMIFDVFDLCEHYALLARYASKILGPGKVRSTPSTPSQLELAFLLISERHMDDETKAPNCLCTHVWLLYNAAGAFNLTAGISQLDFDHGGPSTVARTLPRWLDLQRHGCVHTVFKHARLLLMPDPRPTRTVRSSILTFSRQRPGLAHGHSSSEIRASLAA
jgi:hypothetical protein